MEAAIEPKSLIYTKLSELSTPVFQDRPEVLEQMPCIAFSISSNIPQYDLDSDIGTQNINVNVDIFAKTSTESGDIFKLVELKMREIKYLCTLNADVPDPEGYSHLRLQFTY